MSQMHAFFSRFVSSRVFSLPCASQTFGAVCSVLKFIIVFPKTHPTGNASESSFAVAHIHEVIAKHL